MKTQAEIENAIKNIRYYTKRIRELSNQQLDSEWQQKFTSPTASDIRFGSLSSMQANTTQIDILTNSIEFALKYASEQDKFLETKEVGTQELFEPTEEANDST